jgi:hypothetical protein
MLTAAINRPTNPECNMDSATWIISTPTLFAKRHPTLRQNCSALPPASLSGEGSGEGCRGRCAAVTLRQERLRRSASRHPQLFDKIGL